MSPQVPAEFLPPRADAATPKQVAFIRSLFSERDLMKSPNWFDAVNAMDSEEYDAYCNRFHDEVIPGLTKQQASAWIERLLELPKRTGAKEAHGGFEAIPDGRYALRDADALNPVKFYRVKRGKDYTARGGDDWTGFLFVTRFASDEEYPVRGKARIDVLKAILADPKAAALLFGREENACCICGKRLTRRLSRELGIGPVCGARNGWLTDEFIGAAKDRLIAAGYNPEEELA